MKKNILCMTILLIGHTMFSQNLSSDKAGKLLQKVYDNIQKQKVISIDFSYTLENLAEDIHQDTSGSVYLQGNKYRFEYLGITKIFDGQKIYTIVPDNEEVTIEPPMEEMQGITPEKMLTFYKEGYTYKWDILQPIPYRKIQYVRLHPIKTDSEVKSVLIGVDNKTYELYTIIQIGKNKTRTVITVNKYKVVKSFPEGTFSFDRNYYEKELNYYVQEL